MKQLFGILLLSLGVYSFAFGLYLAAQNMESQQKEKMRQIIYPEGGGTANSIRRSRPQDYPIWLFLLSASGTTFGVWGGIHLLLKARRPGKKQKR